jgi:hypothetical protein
VKQIDNLVHAMRRVRKSPTHFITIRAPRGIAASAGKRFICQPEQAPSRAA